MSYILLIFGIVVLVQGANFFVDGASALAKYFRIPTIIIGLTIVAFGTSAPEAAVSISASVKGLNDIALGNVIGSSLMNILVILGVSALFVPIIVKERLIRREIPFALLSTLLLVVFYFVGHGRINRIEGLIMLSGFVLFMVVLLRGALKNRINIDIDVNAKKPSKSIPLLIFGLAGIILGGELITNNASNIAIELGMSEMLVGLTIIAIGTSLPELVTSLVAAVKKESDIALGNIIGSNIFNILLVLGLSATISPMQLSPSALVDILLLFVITLITLIFAFTNRKISRLEGAMLIGIYIGYLIFIFLRN